jgi:hypothetical protein
VSLFSAGCLFWLERLQPLFVAIAATALGYQVWLVRRRPASRRTKTVMIILWTSIATSALVLATWVGLWLRYR